MTKTNKMVVAGLVTAMSLTGMVAIGIGATTNSSGEAGASGLEAGKPKVITKKKVKTVRAGGGSAAGGSSVPVSATYGGSSSGVRGGSSAGGSVSQAPRPVQEVDDDDYDEPDYEDHDEDEGHDDD